MNYSILIVLSLLLAASSCVKEEGKVSSANTATDTGGGTTGSTEVPGAPDPLASEAWHLENTGQYSFSTGAGTSGEDIDLDDVVDDGDGYTGEGVRIAVSDSGTDIDHEDLTGTQLVGEHRNYGINNPNLWRTTLPDFVEDDAHGTAVAGLIAAEGWNGIGSRGVAPGAKYAAFRFVGEYTATEASYLARSIDQADGNFDIFNYSYGFEQYVYTEVDQDLLDAFKSGVEGLRPDGCTPSIDCLGAIYVQSSGNSYSDYYIAETDLNLNGYLDDRLYFAGNTNVSNDLTIPYKIIVGAINANGEKSSYSTPGSGIWVSAPGGEYGTSSPAMVTTDISGCNHGYSQLTYVLNAFNGGRNSLNSQCSYSSLMNGTSSAAPVLTGVIALMLQAQPLLTWRDVKHILATTADNADDIQDAQFAGSVFMDGPTIMDVTAELTHPLGIAYDAHLYVYDWVWIRNGAGIEYSNWYGFGRVNALKAVLAANTYVLGSLGTYTETAFLDSAPGPIIIPEDATGTVLDAAQPILLDTVSAIAVPDSLIIESVQIKVNLTHPFPSDIGISLISPSGTESRIIHYNSLIKSAAFPADKVLLTNAFFGENASGNWRIRVTDAFGDASGGTLQSWSIKINGH